MISSLEVVKSTVCGSRSVALVCSASLMPTSENGSDLMASDVGLHVSCASSPPKNTPTLLRQMGPRESRMRTRTPLVSTVRKRRRRLYPMVVVSSFWLTGFHCLPSRYSTTNFFTRCPRGIYSCSMMRFIFCGFLKENVMSAVVTPSAVAQYVSHELSVRAFAANSVPRSLLTFGFMPATRL